MLSKLEWLKISIPTRSLMVTQFNVPKSGFTHVSDGQVITDGYSEQDLQSVTIEKLQEYLGSKETDFYKLLEETIKKLEAEAIIEEVNELVKPEEQTEIEVKSVSKRGRPKKILAL